MAHMRLLRFYDHSETIAGEVIINYYYSSFVFLEWLFYIDAKAYFYFIRVEYVLYVRRNIFENNESIFYDCKPTDTGFRIAYIHCRHIGNCGVIKI